MSERPELSRVPRPLPHKTANAVLRVWYRPQGTDPQVQVMDVQVKGLGDRRQLEAQLRELVAPGRLVRWELLPAILL